jgi:hypothetical protein
MRIDTGYHALEGNLPPSTSGGKPAQWHNFVGFPFDWTHGTKAVILHEHFFGTSYNKPKQVKSFEEMQMEFMLLKTAIDYAWKTASIYVFVLRLNFNPW